MKVIFYNVVIDVTPTFVCSRAIILAQSVITVSTNPLLDSFFLVYSVMSA